MTDSPGEPPHSPVAVLLEACEAALGRRASRDWAPGGRARAALDAAKASRSVVQVEGEPERFELISRRFGLTALDGRLLAIAFAAEVDPNLHLLMGLLSGDPGPERPTLALALELAGRSPADSAARARLSDVNPLVGCGLVQLRGVEPFVARRLAMPGRVADELCGDGLPPVHLLPLLLEPAPVDIRGADVLARALDAGQQFVWVHAPIGTAGTGMAAAACLRLGVPCLIADLARHPLAWDRTAGAPQSDTENGSDRSPSLAGLIPDLVREAGLTGAVLVLAGAERAAAAISLLRRASLPVVAVSSEPWAPIWSDDIPFSVRAGRLTLAQRATLWAPIMGGEVPREISALRLTPEAVVASGRHARIEHVVEFGGGQSDPIPVERIRAAVRRLGRSVNTRSTGAVTLADLILPDHVTAEVERLLDWARYRDEVLAQGALQGKGGKGTGICALFSGGPGTGKTLAAHAVADMLGMDLMQVDLSGVISKYIGETEKNLERIFSEAESLNAVLFFDEADSLFGSRSEIKDARDRYANQEVAYLLQRMEHFDGITVLATNLRGNLDPAFARRLHFIITFPDPDLPTRERLWTAHLAQLTRVAPAAEIDMAALGKLELTGGEIRNVVLSAAYSAVAAGRPVAMTDLAGAVVREFSKLGRRVPAGPWMNG